MPESENYLALGVYQEIKKGWALTFTYGFPNDPEAGNLVAVNVSYTLRLSPDVAQTAEDKSAIRHQPSAISHSEMSGSLPR